MDKNTITPSELVSLLYLFMSKNRPKNNLNPNPNPDPSQHPSYTHKQDRINYDLVLLTDLERCLSKGSELAHLSAIDQEDLSSLSRAAKELIKVVESLKMQQIETNELRTFFESNKNVVSNHTSIMKGIEGMYEERIADMREMYMKAVEEKDLTIENFRKELENQGSLRKEQEQEYTNLREQYSVVNQEVSSLTFIIQRLNEEQEALKKQIKVYLSIETNTPLNTEQITARNPLPLILQSEVSPIILEFLPITDILRLGSTSKLAKHILSRNVNINRMLVRKGAQESRAWRDQVTTEMRYYESVVENISDSNIKHSALKFLYFHQKPGEYILNCFKELNENELKKEEPKTRKKSFFTGLLGNEKKDENKFSLKDLGDPEHFKRVEAKIHEYFHEILEVGKGPLLQQFKQATLEQYQDVKRIMLNENPLAKLYLSSKFLYLETQQIHKLSQYLFSLLAQTSKKHQQIKSQFEDICEKDQAVKNTLRIISEQKTKTQDHNWLLEYDLTKERVSNQALAQQLGQTQREATELKEGNQRLKAQVLSVHKKNEEYQKRVKTLEKNIESIRQLFI